MLHPAAPPGRGRSPENGGALQDGHQFTVRSWLAGFHRDDGAGPIANLIYLPLSYASGLWQPVDGLPHFLQQLVPYLPPYHYGRIAWYAIGDDDGNLPLHIAWLLGTALVFGLLAITGYWRDQGKQYG